MASYGNTVLTSAGIDLVKRVIAKTATFEITRVATSSDSRLTNATISTIEALTTMSSVQQTGKVTAFDTSNSKQVGLKCEFTNQGLTNQYNICGVGIYAKEAGKSEILFSVAPAKEPETMPAKPNDQSALFAFSLNMYVVVGQASAMSITATTEGVVKSINSTIKPDANGNVTMSYYSQAEVDQKISSLSSMIDSLNSSKTSNTDFNALKNRVAANESGKADKTSVYDKETADGRYLQRDASTTLKSGSVLRWDDSGHANDDNNVPYTAGGLRWSGKTDNVEIKAEETAVDNLDLVFNLGDDGSNNVDFRWNNVSKAKINSSGKFTGHVDWANVDGKDTYSRAEIDSKINTAKSEASARFDQAQNNINALSSKVTNIRVGGRNLLRNSDKLPYSGNVDRPWLTGQWSAAGATTDKEDMKRQNKEIADPPQGDKATVISFTGILRPSVSDISLVAIRDVPVSGNVTVSFWARQTSGVDTAFVSANWGAERPANVVNTNASTEIWGTASYPYRKLFLPKDGSWTRFWATFNVNGKDNAYIGAGNTGTSAEVQICLVKIETGTMATDWTPAPEDLEDSIDTALNTANAAKAKAEANANSIQALSNKVDTKASSADLASLRNRVSDTESGANTLKGSIASANSLASTAVSTSNTNKGNIEALKTKVENQATAISTQGQKISQNSIKITDAANAISSLDSKMARLMPQAAYVPVQVGDKTDLNNMKTCGFYLLQGGTSNSPVDGWTYVTVQGISTRLTQFVWKDLDPYLQWCRWYDGSSWTAWTQYTKAF